MPRTNPPARYPHDLSLAAGKRTPAPTLLGSFLLGRQWLSAFRWRYFNAGTGIPELRRPQDRLKGAVNFCALLCRHLLWPIRKLDIRSRLCFANNLDVVAALRIALSFQIQS